MYSNLKVLFQILIFIYNRAIEHNIQYQLKFKMSIFQHLLCVHNLIFQQVNILLNVIKQHIINDVQHF